MKIQKNIQTMYQKHVLKTRMLIYDLFIYYLRAFSTEEILNCHIKDCFKINGKQRIIMPEKDEYVKFKNYERKTESLFMIYADFESTLVPEYNEKENPKESYTNKHQKQIVAAMAIHVDKFSKPFKTHLGKDPIYNFINNMIKESKCCSEVMKNHFLKQIAMTKEDNEDFKKSTKC